MPVNQTNDTSDPIPTPSSCGAFKWRRVGVFLLLLTCAVGLVRLLPKPALLPAVAVLPPDYSIPAPPLPMPDRWIPMNWGWLWKLRYAVLGKPAVFKIETKLSYFSEPRSPQLQQLLDGRAPLVFTNGVRAWILPDQELKGLISNLELQHVGRVTTGAGVLTTVSGSTAPPSGISVAVAGYTLTYAVRKRGDSIELSGGFTSSEWVTNALIRSPSAREVISLHTNLMLVANMQIPRGLSVFLYDTNRVHNPNDGVGILIRAKVQ